MGVSNDIDDDRLMGMLKLVTLCKAIVFNQRPCLEKYRETISSAFLSFTT